MTCRGCLCYCEQAAAATWNREVNTQVPQCAQGCDARVRGATVASRASVFPSSSPGSACRWGRVWPRLRWGGSPRARGFLLPVLTHGRAGDYFCFCVCVLVRCGAPLSDVERGVRTVPPPFFRTHATRPFLPIDAGTTVSRPPYHVGSLALGQAMKLLPSTSCAMRYRRPASLGF